MAIIAQLRSRKSVIQVRVAFGRASDHLVEPGARHALRVRAERATAGEDGAGVVKAVYNRSYSPPRAFVSYPSTPLLLEVGPRHNLLRSAVCVRLDSLVVVAFDRTPSAVHSSQRNALPLQHRLNRTNRTQLARSNDGTRLRSYVQLVRSMSFDVVRSIRSISFRNFRTSMRVPRLNVNRAPIASHRHPGAHGHRSTRDATGDSLAYPTAARGEDDANP